MEEPKDPGRTLMTCLSDQRGPVELREFLDLSLELRVDGRIIGTWAPAVRVAGLVEFFKLTGFGGPRGPGEPPDRIMLVPTRPSPDAPAN